MTTPGFPSSLESCPLPFSPDPSLKRPFSSPDSSVKRAYPRLGRDFTCTQCARSFRDNYNLTSHMRVHGVHPPQSNGKPLVAPKFPCGLCEVVVSSQKALSVHMVSHRNDARLEDGGEAEMGERQGRLAHCYMCEGNIEEEFFAAHMKKHADTLSRTSRDLADGMAKYFRSTEEAGRKATTG